MNWGVYSPRACQHQKIAPESQCLDHMITSNSCPGSPTKMQPHSISGPPCSNLTLNCPTSRSLLKSFLLMGTPPAESLPIVQGFMPRNLLCTEEKTDSVSAKVRIIFFPLHSQLTLTMILYFIWALIPALAVIPLSGHISLQPCLAHPLLSASGSLPTT